jgi:O-acetyl-ADP-ribose deacetylase (regulator of RNase III)
MKIEKGDLIKLALDGKFDVIIHGCNCFNTMGAGIALTIRIEFPEALKADNKTHKGNKNKLGTYSSATVTKNGHDITVVNAYTQYEYKGRGVKADYKAIKNVFKKVKRDFHGKRIGYPKIGAGLAKGDWDTISEIINKELEGEDHTLVEYKP